MNEYYLLLTLFRFAILHQDFLAMQIHAIFGWLPCQYASRYFSDLYHFVAAVFVLPEDCRNIALKILIPMLTSEHEVQCNLHRNSSYSLVGKSGPTHRSKYNQGFAISALVSHFPDLFGLSKSF
jgi:hypothetical protein